MKDAPSKKSTEGLPLYPSPRLVGVLLESLENALRRGLPPFSTAVGVFLGRRGRLCSLLLWGGGGSEYGGFLKMVSLSISFGLQIPTRAGRQKWAPDCRLGHDCVVDSLRFLYWGDDAHRIQPRATALKSNARPTHFV